MTKTQEALNYYKSGYFKKSFKLFKTFKIGFTVEERKQITRSFEMYDNLSFYNALGFIFDTEFEKAKNIIENKYKGLL